jgi:hypothetical protein
LNTFHQPEFKQFRGQAIECMTLACAAVDVDTFKKVADNVINILLSIQNQQQEADSKDPTRVYLLSSW